MLDAFAFIKHLSQETDRTGISRPRSPLALLLLNFTNQPSPDQLNRIGDIISGLTEQKGIVGLPKKFADLGVILPQIPDTHVLSYAASILKTILSLPETQDLNTSIGVGLYHKSDGRTPNTLVERALDGLTVVTKEGGNKIGLVAAKRQAIPTINGNLQETFILVRK
ncbi:MAG: hypothetical protein HYW45_02345 [Candidatus Daviesbacteria bacterium]|nr:MAG: hypothetical protein HYW45_02345 [Candidatus Daviesbacteria bacterium]